MSRIKVISVIACLFYVCSVIAQPRIDGGTKAQVVKSSPVVTNFVGWAYDTNYNKWAGYYNAICPSYKGNNKIPKKLSPRSMSYDSNIISLQTKKIKFEGDYYYIILSPYYRGGFLYPEIQEEWIHGKEVEMFVFTVEEFNKLRDIKDGINCFEAINYTTYSSIGFGLYKDLASAITNIFSTKEKLLSAYKYQKYKLYIKKEDESTYRFQKIMYGSLNESTDFKDARKEPNFNFRYFEIKANIFKQLLI